MSKVYSVSKITVVSKIILVSELKTRPLRKVVFGCVSKLTTLTICNNEILVESEPYFGNLVSFGKNMSSLNQIWCLK